MKFFWKSLFVAVYVSFPFLGFSADYQALQPIQMPNGKELNNSDILQYLSNLYTFAIAIAGGLAVIRIVYSGIKYMLSDIVTDKGEAKKSIQAAVYGLLMALGSYVFLYTLNPNLVKFNLNIQQTAPMTGSGVELIEQNEPVYNPTAGPSGAGSPKYTGDVSGINWNDPNQKISEYFTVGDVTKGQSARIPTTTEDMQRIVGMAQELDLVRQAWGSDIEFTSWNRPPAVNASVGGVSGSQHMNGIAVDISPTNGDLKGMQQWLSQNWTGGMGTYNSFTHIDMRGGGGFQKGTPSATW
jgi:hypothetical protein